MAHDVFISHSSKDKPIADAICAKIEAAGVRCWIAPRDIAPGEDWPAAITRGISQSRIMVLVFSSNSNASEDVSRELFLAANSKLVIIPFKIENIEPEPGKQYYLARTHWLDAINPPTQEQIQELVNRVKVLVPPREPEFIEKQTDAELPPATTVQIDQLKQPAAVVLPGSSTKPAPNKSRLSSWFWLVPVGMILIFLLGWAASGLFLKNPAFPIQPTTFPTSASTPKPISTLIPTAELPTPSTGSSEEPFDLAGVWKTDDMHAADNSWNISYSMYIQFTNTKQYVFHGEDTFNSNQPSETSDIVYLNIKDSTFIKKLVYIPDYPEFVGKFQKWTWRIDDGNVLFTIYEIIDTQDLALNDGTITALGTGVKVR